MCLVEGLAFAEFLKVGFKYLTKVDLSESIFTYFFAIRSQIINAILILISQIIQEHMIVVDSIIV
jgi:hypothetical protein